MLFFCTCLALSGCGQLLMPQVDKTLAQLPHGNYRLDPHHSTVLFKVTHLGISSFVGRFNKASARLQYNPKRPQNSVLNAQVAMASLDVNRPDFAKTLIGCRWLCAKKYPRAQFISTGKAVVKGNQLVFNGKLRFRGVTRTEKIRVNIRGGANDLLTGHYTLGFDAHLQFKRSDFGMGRFVPAVGDEVTIEVYAEFLKT